MQWQFVISIYTTALSYHTGHCVFVGISYNFSLFEVSQVKLLKFKLKNLN